MSKYYTGDTVPLGFTITDDLGGVEPSDVKVVILNPLHESTNPVDATIDVNEVSYFVPGTVTILSGLYSAFFICTLTYGERTHRIDFRIEDNPS